MRVEPINIIRKVLRQLKSDAMYPYRPEYGYGYRQAINDALEEIRKIVRNKKKLIG
jgi:hypothetical protein